jgi:hypothetical protein
METIPRDTWLGSVFVSLADADADQAGTTQALHDLTLAARQIDGVAEAGILLVDDGGSLEVAAASSPRADMLEMLQLADGQGPSVESYRSGRLVHAADLSAVEHSWPALLRSARVLGVHGVHSVPLRLRGQSIGAMTLYSTEVDALSTRAASDAHALLQSRTTGRHETAQAQLQSALLSRVLIEQAKGMISVTRATTVEEAFRVLRDHARANNMRLQEAAQLVVDRVLTL